MNDDTNIGALQAIRDLPEARREAYRKLRRQAAKPEPEELELPDIYETAIDEDSIFADHLYADAKGLFSFSPNEWERATVEAELGREDVLGWLRNVPRKSWSFKLPYRYDGDDTAAMYRTSSSSGDRARASSSTFSSRIA